MMALLYLIAAYVVGGFPSGLVIGKGIYKTDIRRYGSHNTGATNAYRVLGPVGGAAVLLLDICKGLFGVFMGKMAGTLFPEYAVYFMIAGGLLAIIGHSCSVFLKFKGGKGVATGLGVILFLAPVETVIVFIVWAIIVALTKIVSLGSIIGAVLVPILMVVFGEPLPVIIFGLCAALLVVIRHKDNIVRLLQGKELKVERIKK